MFLSGAEEAALARCRILIRSALCPLGARSRHDQLLSVATFGANFDQSVPQQRTLGFRGIINQTSERDG
jgi:hypothetical protein